MSLFSGTLLDGELVKLKNGSFSFVVFDCLLSEGNNIMDRPLMHRLKQVKSAITKMTHSDSDSNSNLDLNLNFAYSVTTKQFLPTKDIRKLWTHVVPNLDHPSDGMIFTPVQTSVQVGHHPSLYKYKVGTFNTVDFLVKLVQGSPKSAKIPLIPYYGKTRDISSACILAELWTTRYVRGTHENVLYTTTYVTQEHLQKMSLDKFVQVDNKVVECGWNPNDKMWHLKTVRNKPFSNILATIERTVENIEENIQPEELFTVLNI
jgi:mRNA guanylyltransferase